VEALISGFLSFVVLLAQAMISISRNLKERLPKTAYHGIV